MSIENALVNHNGSKIFYKSALDSLLSAFDDELVPELVKNAFVDDRLVADSRTAEIATAL